MAAFTVCSLAMIGFPPTAAIWSKWYLAVGAGSLGSYAVLAVLFVSTLLNAAYFLPIVWRAFFKPPPEDAPAGFREAPWPCVIALSCTAMLTILLFFFPETIFGLADRGGQRCDRRCTMSAHEERWGGTPVPQPPDVPRRQADEPEKFFDKPKNIRALKIVAIVFTLILIVLDFFLHAHVVLGPEDTAGYYFVFGFVASVLLILVSKAWARASSGMRAR